MLFNVSAIDWNQVWTDIVNWLSNVGVQIVISLFVIFIGFSIISFFARKIRKLLEKKKVDPTICKIIVAIFNWGLKILLTIGVVGYLGLDTSGIASVITTIGLGIGLAVQGALANFAGGILIIVTRPFKVGDYIKAQGEEGTVEDIQITYTVLATPDNKVISLPNGALANGNITNYSRKPERRVDFNFSIAYESDYLKAQEIILNVLNNHEFSKHEPEPMCRVSSHSSRSVDIVARVWTDNSNYWTLYFDVTEQVIKAFKDNGIEIPYSKVDVNLNK